MPKPSRSGSAASQATRTNRDSTCASCPKKISEPFQWSGPRTVFVNSMSDLFQPDVPDDYIEDVVRVMVEADWHTYQVLTKRADRLKELLSTRLRFAADKRHIWWGVSVEDKKYGLPRIKHLRDAPAAVRFLSIEPLLEDLGEFDMSGIDLGNHRRRERARCAPDGQSLGGTSPAAVHAAGRVFFFKQWGGVHKSKTGRLLNGRTHDDMPRIVASIPPRKTRLASRDAWTRKAARWRNFEPLVTLPVAACS